MATVTTHTIQTSRQESCFYRTTCPAGDVSHGTEDLVVFVHGNMSSSEFLLSQIEALPKGLSALAMDLRGYGKSSTGPVDATRGLQDFADDIEALLVALGVAQDRYLHLFGHSLGGGVVMYFASTTTRHVATATLVCPVSPFGFGGTKDAEGTPCNADFAGTGAGGANPKLVAALKAKDRSDAEGTARDAMTKLYWKPPFRPAPADEDRFVDLMLEMALGEANYPGNVSASATAAWPGFSPGTTGVANALCGKYCNVAAALVASAAAPNKVRFLWVHGAADLIVSDESICDINRLGQLGVVPGWPGLAAAPPQPMKRQTRAVLTKYAAACGDSKCFTEVVVEEAAHTPFLERPEEFTSAFHAHLTA